MTRCQMCFGSQFFVTTTMHTALLSRGDHATSSTRRDHGRALHVHGHQEDSAVLREHGCGGSSTTAWPVDDGAAPRRSARCASSASKRAAEKARAVAYGVEISAARGPAYGGRTSGAAQISGDDANDDLMLRGRASAWSRWEVGIGRQRGPS